jgi:hypothetical protein
MGRHGRRVVQQHRDLGTRLDVDRRVVDLRQDREAVRRQVEKRVQPLDQVGLPQRPRQVERPSVDPRGLDAELAPVAGLRQRDVAHVILDVEPLVLDPVRVVELERHAQQLLPKNRRQVQPALDVFQEPLEAYPPPGRGRRIVDVDEGDVRIGVPRLRIDETCILTAQLAHDLLSFRCRLQSSRV